GGRTRDGILCRGRCLQGCLIEPGIGPLSVGDRSRIGARWSKFAGAKSDSPAEAGLGHQEPPTLATAAAGLAPIADASEAWRRSTVRARPPRRRVSPRKPAATAGGRHLRNGPAAEIK